MRQFRSFIGRLGIPALFVAVSGFGPAARAAHVAFDYTGRATNGYLAIADKSITVGTLVKGSVEFDLPADSAPTPFGPNTYAYRSSAATDSLSLTAGSYSVVLHGLQVAVGHQKPGSGWPDFYGVYGGGSGAIGNPSLPGSISLYLRFEDSSNTAQNSAAPPQAPPYRARYDGYSSTKGEFWISSAAATFCFTIDSVTPRTAPAHIAVMRPETHEWFLRNDGSASVLQYGGREDRPVPGDYLGRGSAQLAVFRPSTGEWFIGGDHETSLIPSPRPDDVPVPADYHGAGHLQIAVYRPTTAEWSIRSDGGNVERVQFGAPWDVPVPGDYLGLGHASIAVMRPGTHEWFLRQQDGGAVRIQFGGAEDQPVPADYLGTGRMQVAVMRPSTHEWFVRNEDGSVVRTQFGGPGDVAVPADYDGVGRALIAVMRPSTHEWFILKSDGTLFQTQFGGVSDLPVPAAFSSHSTP